MSLNVKNVFWFVVVLSLFMTTTKAQNDSGFVDYHRKLEALEVEERDLLNKLDSHRTISEELSRLSDRWVKQSMLLKVLLETSLGEQAACDKMVLEFEEISASSDAIKRDMETSIEQCYSRVDEGTLGLEEADAIVKNIKYEVDQLKEKGQINQSEAITIDSSLKRIRAQYAFFKSELEYSKTTN